MLRGELLCGILHGGQLGKVLMMAGEILEHCDYLISPRLLNRCRLYRRGESGGPEKCWDDTADPRLPESARRQCPNNTARRSPLRFTEQQLADAYPVFGKLKSHEKKLWDHEGGYDERPYESESVDPEEDA